MRNQYRGRCADGCGTMVEAGEGYFERIAFRNRKPGDPKWKVRCVPCVVKKKLASGVAIEDMSHEQQAVARVLTETPRRVAPPTVGAHR